MRTHSIVAALLLAAAAPAPQAWAAPSSVAARAEKDARLGRKADAGGPSKDLAGDVSREKTSPDEQRPGIEYDTFRFSVELQLKDKRRELMGTLDQMVALGGDSPEQPDLLFRLAELNWEESRYWFFEANRQEDKALRCDDAGDAACASAARAEQKEFIAKRDEFQGRAILRYKELIQRFPDYKRVDEVLFFLGHNYWEARKEQEALAAYKTLITRFPKSRYVADAWLAFGEWYFNNSNGKRDMLQKALDAYTKAAAFTESRVYGFAVYKQGWCLYNLGNYAAAADKFKATVFYGELAQNVANANKTALIREARKDYVLAYSHFGDPTAAKASFQQVGGDDEWWGMLKGLAGLYYDNGQDKEAVLVYRQLIREQPLSPEAPLFQARIVSAVMRVGHKKITVEQARLLVKIFQDVEKSGVIRTDDDRKKLEEARDLSERTLSNLAVSWHNEGKRSRHEETFVFSSQAYNDYLAIFPDSPKAYDLRFFHAELLYENLRKYDWAAAEYERVAAIDIAKLEEKKKLEAEGKADEAAKIETGKWFVKALEGSIFAHDEVVKKLGDEPLPKNADPKKALPIPAPKQALLTACESYLTWVPQGDKRVEIAYKAAQIQYRYNHFEPAVQRFAQIAMEHPEHELAVFSAHLVLDSYNILEDWQKIDEWAKRFHGEPRLARGPFKVELEQIIERNSFKMVALLEKEEKYAEAGNRYLAFVADWPKSDLADEALFNAAVDFHKAGRPEQAIEVRERLAREYPRSELAPEALYLNAAAQEEMTNFEAAAGSYERYAQKWEAQAKPPKRRGRRAPAKNEKGPKYEESKAKAALFNAGIFREALGQHRQALRDRQRWLELWPRDADAEAVFLSVADLHEKSGNGRLAVRQLEAYQKERWARDPSKRLAAQGRIAKIQESRGLIGARNKIYEEVWRTYSRLPGRTRAGLSAPALEAVASAHFVLSEPTWREYQRIRIRLPQEVMARALKEKGQKLLAVQKRYTETVSLKAAGPGICALDRIGLAYRSFAQALYDAPVPRGFSEEEVSLYKAALAEQAMPVEAKAQEAFATAVAKSRELGVHNSCAAEALSMLEQSHAEGFAKLVEEPAAVTVAARRQGLGLLLEEQPIPPPPPPDASVPAVVNEKAPSAPAPAAAAAPVRGDGPTAPVDEPPLPSREGEPEDPDLLP
ncbi:tetratricopeptide repeat protein [Vulgatibacter sp.]|uniref:tetratricopeptide repeat protein n=1 Tax=Vulgatibacter sp. TaxID=1971226 RepID=UPI0035641D46